MSAGKPVASPGGLPPGSWLGLLGGGQLGRMFCMAAQSLGYRVCVLDPGADSPAGSIAERHLQADYLDEAALDELAGLCKAVTTEFENVPAQALERLAARCIVSPRASSVAIAQDRIAEKSFLCDSAIPVAPWAAVLSRAMQLVAARENLQSEALTFGSALEALAYQFTPAEEALVASRPLRSLVELRKVHPTYGIIRPNTNGMSHPYNPLHPRSMWSLLVVSIHVPVERWQHHGAHSLDARHVEEAGHQAGGHRLVEAEDHDRGAAAGRAAHLHERDVDLRLAQDAPLQVYHPHAGPRHPGKSFQEFLHPGQADDIGEVYLPKVCLGAVLGFKALFRAHVPSLLGIISNFFYGTSFYPEKTTSPGTGGSGVQVLPRPENRGRWAVVVK